MSRTRPRLRNGRSSRAPAMILNGSSRVRVEHIPGRILIDGEIYAPSEAKEFLQAAPKPAECARERHFAACRFAKNSRYRMRGKPRGGAHVRGNGTGRTREIRAVPSSSGVHRNGTERHTDDCGCGHSRYIACDFGIQRQTGRVKTGRAKFWLDLRDRFAKHDEVHRRLRPGGRWPTVPEGPETASEWADVEAYTWVYSSIVK